MNSDIFLYTVPQWIIFAGVFVAVYGWVEDKKPFRVIGIAIFTLLGIYATFILLGDYFAAADYLTPEEVMREEIDEEIVDEIPFQARLFPAYISFLIAGILSLPTLFFELKNKKFSKIVAIITGLVALLGFFIIVGALKTV